MDIKDFILIGGGILIASVVGHGFWIAWRAKREPLRIDIVPDLINEDVDEIERLRGELPNGGGRVVQSRRPVQNQENLELDLSAPVLMDPATASTKSNAAQTTAGSLETSQSERGGSADRRAEPRTQIDAELTAAPSRPDFSQPKKIRPRVHQAPPRAPVEPLELSATEKAESQLTTGSDLSRAQVHEVQVDLAPIVTEPGSKSRSGGRESKSRLEGGARSARGAREVDDKSRVGQDRPAKDRVAKDSSARDTGVTAEAPVVEELLIVNILAPRGERFEGEALVNALRAQGLRYGDMNIFHRIDPGSKSKVYCVANAIEPGTFDLSDLNNMHSPGITFFLQLPGPVDASGVFEHMLQAARNVAVELGGELRDEQLSALTGQSMEHMRQRIADFARRRLSKRA